MKQLKIDTTQIKNIIQKLVFLKNYFPIVVAGIITLTAIFIFLFVQFFLGSKLRKDIDKNSVGLGRRVSGLTDSAISIHQVDEEKKYQDAYSEDANNIVLLATQNTQRELLSYKIFPEPEVKSGLVFEEFAENYCKGIDGFIKKYGGGYPLTEAEIEEIISRSKKTVASRSDGKTEETTDTIKNELCLQRAASISFYINPADLGGYSFWRDFKFDDWQKTLKDCWSWQMGYWVIEDVLSTMGKINSGSSSVITSPVKRIMSVTFTGESSGDTNSTGAKPTYIVSAGEGQKGTFTGRYTNEELDVLQFNAVVLVDRKSMLAFMKELCSAKTHVFKGFSGKETPQTFKHNQITILSSVVNLLDKQGEGHVLCRYGDSPVLELKLTCEYVFNKNGYAQIKPVFSEGGTTESAGETGVSTPAGAGSDSGKDKLGTWE